MSKNYTETLADGTSFDMIWVEGGTKRLMGMNWVDDKEYLVEVEIRFLKLLKK